MKINAHAKINLTLGIEGVRADGYHEVEMIMQAVELHDCLVVEELPAGIVLESLCPDLPPGPENLVYRAAAALQEYTGCRRGARIKLTKNIPLAAGLAGGSTDAAAALRALNKLWDLHLPGEELFRLGERMGADVPFCLLGGTALARGKGERLTPVKGPKGLGVVLVKPPFGVSTALVYSLYDQIPPGSQPDTQAMLAALENGQLSVIGSLLHNSLERITIKMHPVLDDIKKALLTEGAAGALMSGSGPTVFGLFSGIPEARAAARRLNLPGCGIIATSTI